MKMFRRTVDHARAQQQLEDEVRRLGALIGAGDADLVAFGNRDGGYPWASVDESGVYHWIVTERGQELQHRKTRDLDEMLFWCLEATTWSMGGDWALRHPVAGEEQRVTRWRKQFALLATINPEWPHRARQRLIERIEPANLPEGGIPPADG
ncbi:hypothetical protein FB565_008891 [Actinoplanes lutulentus]|uniref:Immunity protein 63 of polymorphic toxin system n=1 Tax=Actinoplanes lutulentus TaxID=1287878 RepID=A0A327Z5C8_9ACTN|nr:Imm63 family immunity protein [Actinoplanes lutulentus]MBB2949086.1 hypothetical protein [Actinoplanes lutulentus]RAK31407.1 immunity protein 63 of polymorphic toxin system [Actinoplanes lutulentus]